MQLIKAVRIEIGDTDCENGILPGRKQFSDIDFAYAIAAENIVEMIEPTLRDIGRVSAKLLEIASTTWASQPIESELGPASEVNNASILLARKAAKMRALWGYGAPELAEGAKKRSVSSYVGVGMYPSLPGIN